MDLLLLVAGLAALSIPLAVLGAAVAGDPPDLLADLFRDAHDLGWPIGVQEDDLPPHVPLVETPPPCDPVAEPVSAALDEAAVVPDGRTGWRSRVRVDRVAAGSAHRKSAA
ncbi:MAG TPA: hypothetical protein VGK63_05535 [Candidatus Limnocylindrales bacterium]